MKPGYGDICELLLNLSPRKNRKLKRLSPYFQSSSSDGSVKRSRRGHRQSCAPRIDVLDQRTAQTKQAFHPLGLGEFVVDLSEKDKNIDLSISWLPQVIV